MMFYVDLLPEEHPTNSLKFFPDFKPDSITIHYTGEQYGQTPQVVRDWWESQTTGIAAHFVIKDNVCLQCLPIHRSAFHCGHPTGNRTSLGIEVIPHDKSGIFSGQSKATLKELLSLFNPVPLLRHHDWSGKNCPKYYIDNEKWEQLKLAITPDWW